ncbi:hypothetical protein RvY_14062 [Ramazzottius varieornatus]|uniref:Anaphase-promoting complex subunit 5 n=1 Tax=Ramazzottius varieornatus TaxID=947166 RepID=A0A1D1VV51_RAMVA|nr:hypothetical protein RvY_14062 [Ramazzottius varieornatus]
MDAFAEQGEVLHPYNFLVAVLVTEYFRCRRELQKDRDGPKSGTAKDKEVHDCRAYLLRHGIDMLCWCMSSKETFDTLRTLQHLCRSPQRDFTSLMSLIRLAIVKPHFLLVKRVIEMLRREDHDDISRYAEMNFSQVNESVKMENASGALFVRKVKLLFDEMDFGAWCRFSTCLSEYLSGGVQTLDEMYGNFTSFMEKTEALEDTYTVPVISSGAQTKYVREWQLELLQSNPIAASDLLGVTDKQTNDSLTEPSAAIGVYVEFLQAMQQRDYVRGEELVRKYDLLKSAQSDCKWLVEGNGGLQSGDCSLHLCIMHYTAGHHQLAVQSLKECIFLAQERGDKQLLNSAMYWLACVEVNSNQYDKLFRGVHNVDIARDGQKISADFATLTAQFDSLVGAGLSKVLRDLEYAEVSPPELDNRITIQQYANRANVWKMYGFDDIATIYAQGSIQLFARAEVYGLSVVTEGVAVSANVLIEQACRTNDESSLQSLLDFCTDVLPIEEFGQWHVWAMAELVWRYDRAFGQQGYALCHLLVDHMSKISLVEASLRKSELLFWDECCPKKALQLLQSMLDNCEGSAAHLRCLPATSTLLKLRISLLKATILQETACFLEALQVLQKALGLVMDHPNEIWKAKVQLHLAYVWLGLEQVQQARNALDVCFPILCGCEYPTDQARAWFLRGLLAEEGSVIAQEPKSTLHCYEQALQSFSVCTSVRMMMSCLRRMALLCDKAGDIVRREQSSDIFLNLCEKYPHVDQSGSF